MKAAFDLQDLYEVEVIPFSWPSNGGGVSGTLSNFADKRDVRALAGALERTLNKIHEYLMLINESSRLALREKARRNSPKTPNARDALYADLL